VVLHCDEALLPRAAKARAAWNYRVSAAGAEQATVTYWMNTLQHLKTKTPVLVTLNQSEAIRPEKVFERLSYAHPIFDAPALAAQGRFSEINGQRQTYYCGAYWRYGFHEDGCASALRALNVLGWDW
jgi:predicted NAD/FAD-binding protein